MDSFVTSVLGRFGAGARESGARLESRSGAGVHAVRAADGRAAYLKVALDGQVEAARRELHFYREIAPSVPVRTPELLDGVDTGDGVAMLLAEAGEPVPVEAWTPAMWAALGRDLAALHAMPWPADPSPARPDALRRALAEPDRPAIEAFWGPVLPRLGDLLAGRDELARAIDARPPVFVHGDCHTGNLMWTGGSLVFLDWQVSGTGRPGSDLAFLNVRAVPAGVTAPPELLDAYDAGRAADRRALLAEELAVFVFLWPPFAAYNSAAGVDRVHRRARALSEHWFGA